MGSEQSSAIQRMVHGEPVRYTTQLHESSAYKRRIVKLTKQK